MMRDCTRPTQEERVILAAGKWFQAQGLLELYLRIQDARFGVGAAGLRTPRETQPRVDDEADGPGRSESVLPWTGAGGSRASRQPSFHASEVELALSSAVGFRPISPHTSTCVSANSPRCFRSRALRHAWDERSRCGLECVRFIGTLDVSFFASMRRTAHGQPGEAPGLAIQTSKAPMNRTHSKPRLLTARSPSVAEIRIPREAMATISNEIVRLLPAGDLGPAGLSEPRPCGDGTKACGGRLAWGMPALACPGTKGRCFPRSCGGGLEETNSAKPRALHSPRAGKSGTISNTPGWPGPLAQAHRGPARKRTHTGVGTAALPSVGDSLPVSASMRNTSTVPPSWLATRQNLPLGSTAKLRGVLIPLP